MENNLNQLFKNISDLEPSSGLEKAILHRIELEKRGQIRRKLTLSYVGLGGSFLASVYAGFALGGDILHSEFWSVVSLFFSDAVVVAGHWKEFALSLLETFPVVNLVAILAPVFTLLISLIFYLDLSKNNNHKYI